MKIKFLWIILFIFFSLGYSEGKAPIKLNPVEINGIKYVPISTGTSGIIWASDLKTGTKLWEITLFKVLIVRQLEADVQDIFINAIEYKDG
jgi:hypothetical protein